MPYTRTTITLEVSSATFDEIRKKLEVTDYRGNAPADPFVERRDGHIDIDMTGIILTHTPGVKNG